MRTFALALILAACSGGSSTTPDPQPVPSQPAPTPTPTESEPPTPALMTPEDCTAKGGTVKGDIGDGKVACDEGQRELGKVRTGIEGGVCCAPPTP